MNMSFRSVAKTLAIIAITATPVSARAQGMPKMRGPELNTLHIGPTINSTFDGIMTNRNGFPETNIFGAGRIFGSDFGLQATNLAKLGAANQRNAAHVGNINESAAVLDSFNKAGAGSTQVNRTTTGTIKDSTVVIDMTNTQRPGAGGKGCGCQQSLGY